MKKLISWTLAFILVGNIFAQGQAGKANIKVIPENNVPQNIRNTHKNLFSGGMVEKWERHNVAGKAVKFVAVLTDNGVKVRSRYRPNGENISYTYYYGKNLPDNVKQQVSQNYQDFMILGGYKTVNAQKSKEFFRIRLRRQGQKLIIYTNADGGKISKNDIPADLLEDDAPEEEKD
jgi:hypothetical protein